jgi:cytokinin riboside 5'-monophosphate phosphoribohydrolase
MSTQPIRAVTVYCSSSNKVAPVFVDATAELGRAIAHAGWKLVYGGNAVGLMKTLADATRDAGGKVIGVTPRLFIDKGVGDCDCEELIVTDGMRDRKAQMEQRGDAFVALPGGFGTFEEFFEIICGKQLGYHNKPIVLLNIAGYYDPLLAMIERGHEMSFIRPRARELYHVATIVADAVQYLRNYRPTPPRADLSFETSPPPSAVE